MKSLPRIAIVSDPLVQRGGAERVVEAMAEAFPDAPVFAIFYSPVHGPASLEERVTTSFLQRIPGASRRHRAFFALYVAAIESFDLSEFDLIISSHHTVAKGLLRGSDQLHVCYCHTPMRALWERSAAEIGTLPAIMRFPAASILSALRVWDVATASRVDEFIANSRVTQKRISKHYRRESVIINPPIDLARFAKAGLPLDEGSYYLVVARAVPYKRVDIAVNAALAAGRRVVVAGGMHKGLPNDPMLESVGIVDDGRLLELMQGARALLFPQYEDFGMTPLEMNACGRPVIAYANGGALETVVDGQTGVLVADQSVAAFIKGIERLESLRFDPSVLRLHAEHFSKMRFIERMRECVYATWERRFETERSHQVEGS